MNSLAHAQIETGPLKIAIVTETYTPEINGVARTMEQIVTGLLPVHQVQLIRPAQDVDDQSNRKGNLETITVKGQAIPFYDGLRFGWPSGRKLKSLWKANRPDVVYVSTEGPLGLTAVLAARKLRIPVVTGFHTHYHSYTNHYGFGFLEQPAFTYMRWLHNISSRTLVPTEALKNELNRIGIENAAVMARGINTNLFRPERRSEELRNSWGVSSDEIVFLYVGRLASEKNLELYLQMQKAVSAENKNARFVLVGDGPMKAELEKNSELILTGTQRGEDLAAHYASGDVFVFPSVTDTFGNVVLEAMASGLAVLSFNYAAAGQHVVQNQSGLLAPFGNSFEFIQNAVSLAGKPEKISSLGESASRSVQSISWKNIIVQFESYLREAIVEMDETLVLEKKKRDNSPLNFKQWLAMKQAGQAMER